MGVSLEEFKETATYLSDTSGRLFIEPYQDVVPNMVSGREYFPTNVEAFREYAQNSEQALGLVHILRTCAARRASTIGLVRTLSAAVFTLPEYITLKAHNPIGFNELPPAIIDAGRAAAGIALISYRMGADGREDEAASAESIVAYGNGANPQGRNYFVSKNEPFISCPAPERLITTTIEAFIELPTVENLDSALSFWLNYITVEDIRASIRFGTVMYLFKALTRKQLQNQATADDEAFILTLPPLLNTALGYK